MRKVDKAHLETDKLINKTERQMKKVYNSYDEKMIKKADTYFRRFQINDEKMLKALNSGDISVQDYKKWRTETLLSGKEYTQFNKEFAKAMTDIDKVAIGVSNTGVLNSYVLNANAVAKAISTKVNINFKLYNKNAVQRLNKAGTITLPYKNIKVSKNVQWNQKIINNTIRNSIIKGDNINKIAKELWYNVKEMNYKGAVRTARTSITNAENAGRLDMLNDIKEKYDIETQKQWITAGDDVVRDSHAEIDGEICELDEEFSNGLMYPADESGEPEEVYNCRCTMIYLIKGVDY